MTVYISDKAITDVNGNLTINPVWTENREVVSIATYTFATGQVATLTAGDTFKMQTIPRGLVSGDTKLTGITLDTDIMDAGTVASTVSVGIAGTPAKFVSAVNTTQAGGIQSANVAGTHGYAITADTQLIVTVVVTGGGAVPTSVPRSIRLIARYSAQV